MKPETRERRLSYGVPQGATHVNPETLMYYKLDKLGVWQVWFGFCDLWSESRTANRNPKILELIQ